MTYIFSLNCKLGLIPIWCGSRKSAFACTAIAYILKTCSANPKIFWHQLSQHHASWYLNSLRLKAICRYHVIDLLLSLWVNCSQQHRGTVSNLNTFLGFHKVFQHMEGHILHERITNDQHILTYRMNIYDFTASHLYCLRTTYWYVCTLCTEKVADCFGRLFIWLYLYIGFAGVRPSEWI